MHTNSDDSVIRAETLMKRVSSPEGELTILDQVSFEVRRGETVAIVGASGSGKSTLLGLLAGLDLPTQGRVLLDGQDLNQLDEDGGHGYARSGLGLCFRHFNCYPI